MLITALTLSYKETSRASSLWHVAITAERKTWHDLSEDQSGGWKENLSVLISCLGYDPETSRLLNYLTQS